MRNIKTIAVLYMKLRYCCSLFLVLFTLNPLSASAATGYCTVLIDQDTFVNNEVANVDTNFANATELQVKSHSTGQGGISRSFVKVSDLLAATCSETAHQETLGSLVNGSADIVSARLRLFGNNTPGVYPGLNQTDAHTVQRVVAAWDEGTVTWNASPAVDATENSNAGDRIGLWPGTNYRSWDVTNDVKLFVDTPASNHGWRVKADESGTTEDGVIYLSQTGLDDNGYQQGKPKLIIEFNLPQSWVNSCSGTWEQTLACRQPLQVTDFVIDNWTYCGGAEFSDGEVTALQLRYGQKTVIIPKDWMSLNGVRSVEHSQKGHLAPNLKGVSDQLLIMEHTEGVLQDLFSNWWRSFPNRHNIKFCGAKGGIGLFMNVGLPNSIGTQDRIWTWVHEVEHQWDGRSGGALANADPAHSWTFAIDDIVRLELGNTGYGTYLDKDIYGFHNYNRAWDAYMDRDGDGVNDPHDLASDYTATPTNPNTRDWYDYWSDAARANYVSGSMNSVEIEEEIRTIGGPLRWIYAVHGRDALKAFFTTFDVYAQDNSTYTPPAGGFANAGEEINDRYVRFIADALQVDAATYFDYWKWPVHPDTRAYTSQYTDIALVSNSTGGAAHLDDDGDGFSELEGDFNDSDASIYPYAPELADGKDNNFDGLTDELAIYELSRPGLPADKTYSYTDLDSMGLGTIDLSAVGGITIKGRADALTDKETLTFTLSEDASVFMHLQRLQDPNNETKKFNGFMTVDGPTLPLPYINRMGSGRIMLPAGTYTVTIEPRDHYQARNAGDYVAQLFISNIGLLPLDSTDSVADFYYPAFYAWGPPSARPQPGNHGYTCEAGFGVTVAQCQLLVDFYDQYGPFDILNNGIREDSGWLVPGSSPCDWNRIICSPSGVIGYIGVYPEGNDFIDTDGDGTANYLDNCPLDNGNTCDPGATDDDGDGYPNDFEILNGTDTLDFYSVPADYDGDLILDPNDPDDDNDGVVDELDNCPKGTIGTGAAPLNADADYDGCDDVTEDVFVQIIIDTDNDRYSDSDEVACGYDPASSGSIPEDFDLDYVPDCIDDDDDNDGMTDICEVANGLNAKYSLDADVDIDGDGFYNYVECLSGTNPNDMASKPVDTYAYVLVFEDPLTNLYGVNLDTGEKWLIGDTGILNEELKDLTRNSNGTLYTIGASTKNIYTIDTQTGQAAYVTTALTNSLIVRGFEIDANDQAWILTQNGVFIHQLDLQTGVTNKLAAAQVQHPNSLTSRSGDNWLYYLGYGLDNFSRMDKTTGEVEVLSQNLPVVFTQTLTVNSQNVIWYLDDSSRVRTLNHRTGLSNQSGNLGFGFNMLRGITAVLDNDGDGNPDQCFGSCFGGLVEDADDDNDGYSDADEITNSTDPFNALDTPPDNDGDFDPDSSDPDDDNDGMPDSWELTYSPALDPFVDDAALDADMDGYNNLGEYLNNTDPTLFNFEPLDLNADGDGDLVFQDNGSGSVVVWQLENAALLNSAYIADIAMGVVAITDVDADADVDIVFQDAVTGDVVLWIMENGLRQSATWLGVLSDYQLAATGDVDGDGDGDLVFDDGLGNVLVWVMEDGTKESSNWLGLWAGQSVMALADIDSDADDDIITQDASGSVNVIEMENANKVEARWLGIWSGRVVVAAGDTDADGDDDILMETTSPAGDVMVIEVESGNKVLGRWLGIWTGTQVQGVGDIDNDGDVDLVQQNAGTGSVQVVELQNNQKVIGRWLGNFAYDLKGVVDADADNDIDVVLQDGSGNVALIVIENGAKQGGAKWLGVSGGDLKLF